MIFFWPEQILQLAPPAGGPPRDKGKRSAFRLSPANAMGLQGSVLRPQGRGGGKADSDGLQHGRLDERPTTGG